MSVSLFPSKDSFETANITAGSRDINSASSASGDEERALRYRATGLSTAEERETSKALRVAKDMRYSAKIAEKYHVEKCELKKQLEEDKERRFKARELRKKQMLIHWSRKLDKSSFLVDQVAESERIDEEQRVKLEEEARRAKLFEERKQKIKTEIILKALTEGNDLDQLRQEKRLIHEEERRLKVQQAHNKQDALANKAEMLREIQEKMRQRNEIQFIQQRNRLALQHSEEQKRRDAILMKMQMKYGDIPGEYRLSSSS
jgi:galactokinase